MKVLFVFGTRPEAIKLAPLIIEFRKHSGVEVSICITAQHREMLDQSMRFFGITPDYDLNIMRPNQTLFDITSSGLKGLENVLNELRPDIIFVQGDTSTAFIGALSGFYAGIKVAHVEAGLRSNNKHSPFPEETNRVLIGHIADLHFAPTERGRENLIKEGIRDGIHVVGNSVIDAIFLCLELIKDREVEIEERFAFINNGKRLVLVTGHRRESFGEPFKNICKALRKVALNTDVEIVYPVHLNPNVRKPVFEILAGIDNLHLIDPVEYPELIWLLSKSHIVLTDSGGIQEEAPALGKPVLVMRDVTERTEGIEAGAARLVGTDTNAIFEGTMTLLNNSAIHGKMSKAVNPYGDGKTAKRIFNILDRTS
ncbi:MAG: UDP-N-acetylglucosamine 2-epimerase (non-hydrolyzing) [Thermodesulfobacteriota bacterium]